MIKRTKGEVETHGFMARASVTLYSVFINMRGVVRTTVVKTACLHTGSGMAFELYASEQTSSGSIGMEFGIHAGNRSTRKLFDAAELTALALDKVNPDEAYLLRSVFNSLGALIDQSSACDRSMFEIALRHYVGTLRSWNERENATQVVDGLSLEFRDLISEDDLDQFSEAGEELELDNNTREFEIRALAEEDE